MHVPPSNHVNPHPPDLIVMRCASSLDVCPAAHNDWGVNSVKRTLTKANRGVSKADNLKSRPVVCIKLEPFLSSPKITLLLNNTEVDENNILGVTQVG